MSRAGRMLVGVLVLASLIVPATPALAYLKFGTTRNGSTVSVKWNRAPIGYRIYDAGIAGVSAGQLQEATARAFASWERVPTASIRYAFEGFSGSARPGDEDFVSTLGFDERPELDRVLASTTLLIDEETGELVESDIFFNSAFPWSVAEGGQAGHFDLESIALHEIGHFSGLGHSALGETELLDGGRRVLAAAAAMFPIAFGPGSTGGRMLRPDDIAGISDLYPDSGFADNTGSLSGRVTLRDGTPVFGAHVVAFNARSGTLVGNFTLNFSGQFSIGGLAPGAYVVRVEPLDDADVESFLEDTFFVNLDFRATVHNRLVVVPKGGDSGNTVIRVRPK